MGPGMERTIRIAAAALTIAVALLGFWVGRNVVERIGQPWPGFGVLADARIGPPGLLPLRLQPAVAALRYRDRLLAVDGRPFTSPAMLDTTVAAVPIGTPITYRLERTDGSIIDVAIPTRVLTMADFAEACLPFLAGAFFGLALGLAPVLSRPDLVLARLFFVINLGLVADIAFRLVGSWGTQAYPRIGWLTTGIWVGAFVHLALLNPTRREPLRRFPRTTLLACYGGGIASALANVLLDRSAGLNLMMYGGGLIWPLNVALTMFRSDDPRLRQQARIMAVGFAPFFAAITLLTATLMGFVPPRLPLITYFVPFWVFGAVLCYAVIEHNLFEVGAVVRQMTTLGLLGLFGIALYAGLFTVYHVWLSAAVAWAAAGVSMVLVLTLAPVVSPLRRRLEATIEHRFFPRQREARAAVHTASRELARLRDERELVEVLRETVTRTMAGASVRLVGGAGELTERGPTCGAAPVTIAAADPLHALAVRRATISFERLAARPQRGSRAAAEQAATLGVSLLVPLPVVGTLAGALLVGSRTDGRLFTRDDEMLLETLAAQVAVALENAHAWDAVHALERRLLAENVYLREEVQLAHDPQGIVGRSPALRAALAQVEQVAPTDATVLVIGETGTGKELVVRALHAQSRRADRALVKVACAALPETLLESELFGHERGAFTGATARKPGRFEVADGGTLFLDDVDTLPLGVQAKLLRAIQEGEVQRLGSNALRTVDVRVVAATNRDLLGEVRAGRFREDLYYRLNVVPIHLPPLRERREDIAALVEHFVALEGPKLGRRVKAVAAEAMATLEAYRWPGNVRELHNVIQRALVLCSGDVLRLPAPLETPNGSEPSPEGTDLPLAERVRDLKIQAIRGALAAAGGNQRIAAERLGLHRQSLTRMIRDLGLR